LVIEFAPSVDLDPQQLKLIGTSPDRWKLSFEGLPTRGLRRIGEGDLSASSHWNPGVRITPTRTPIDASGLPKVPQGRYRVVIDPGHGGPDPGAIGIRGLRETDVVLDISLQVAQLLEARGVNVVMTRTAEVDVDLPPRVAIANRMGATAFVSIHANAISMSRPDVNGIETFYFSDPRSGRLAAHIQRQVLNVSPGSPNRGVRRGRFFVIRRTTMPSILVETGFLTGRIDAPRLATAAHRRKLALAIATGILNYLQGVR
jgi:N-acetylmuramoyl-L-alanine amidase